MGVSKTREHIQIKIKMPNPSQEPTMSSKAPNQDLKDLYDLCTFKIKKKSKDLNQAPYQDLKVISFAPPKSRQKAKIWNIGLSQTISKSRSKFQTEVQSLRCPEISQIRTYRTYTLESFHFKNCGVQVKVSLGLILTTGKLN